MFQYLKTSQHRLQCSKTEKRQTEHTSGYDEIQYDRVHDSSYYVDILARQQAFNDNDNNNTPKKEKRPRQIQ